MLEELSLRWRFDVLAEQPEAKRLLDAALAEGPAHAYLLHGPPGVGKRRAAFALRGRDPRRGDAGRRRLAHPDLYLLEPLGEMIRIDEIRRLRHDLHMRPFEAQHRVYVIDGAQLMNDEAADALLKDLEEPPSYAVIVLVADELGPLPPTIRSRCQLVPFRRLSERSLARVPRGARARAGRGRSGRRSSGSRPAGSTGPTGCSTPRRAATRRAAPRRPRPYAEPEFEPADAAATLLEVGACRSASRRGSGAEAELEGLDLTAREAEQRSKRAQRGAEREELLASLEELASWYRDLVVVAVGAETAVVHADRVELLREDATRARALDAELAAEAVRELWRELEEFNLAPALALEALFVRLRQAFAGSPVA